MADYHLFLFYNGVLWSNWSVGSISVGQEITLGFTYTSPNVVTIFWNNGTLHTYTAKVVEQVGTSFEPESLSTITSSFIIDVQNSGPTFGYGQWVVVSYQYDVSETIPPYAVTFAWTAVTMGNGVDALYAFTDADNPVNISTNATSCGV